MKRVIGDGPDSASDNHFDSSVPRLLSFFNLVSSIDESNHRDKVNRYRKWNEEVFEPTQRRILKKLEQRMVMRDKRCPAKFQQYGSSTSARFFDSESPQEDPQARLCPRRWTRDRYDSTLEGMQKRASSHRGRATSSDHPSVPGAPYQDHYKFMTEFASFTDSEFPRGKRTCKLPSYYRRNPLL